MGMSYVDTFPKLGKLKFERSGFLGRGNKVSVYHNGKKVDEFYLSDWVMDTLNDDALSKDMKFSNFKCDCQKWISEYGVSLIDD